MPSLKSKSKSRSKKVRSAPTKSKSKSKPRSKSKPKKALRKTRSVPTKLRSKSKTLQKKAESIYPRFVDPSEIEMKYLKTLYDKYGDVSVFPGQRMNIQKSKEREKWRQQGIMDQMKRIEQKSSEEVRFGDLPYLQGKTKDGLRDPDIVLGQLDCKERVAWCSSNRENREHCKKTGIHDLYILPCKVSSRVNRSLYYEICELDIEYPNEDTRLHEFREDMKDMVTSLDQVMEMDIYSYLGRYLTYGYDTDNEDKSLEIYVKCKISGYPFLGQLREDGIAQYGRDFDNMTRWSEDEFMEKVEDLIGVDQMKGGIERMMTNARTWSENSNDPNILGLYTKVKETTDTFEEGSLSWWTSALMGEIYSTPPREEEWGGKNRMFDFMMNLENSFLGIFNGSEFEGEDWFTDNTDDIYFDFGWQDSRLRDVIRWMKHPQKREDVYERLKRMKDRFVQMGGPIFKDEMIITSFKEFIDLLNTYNPVLTEINDELKKHSNQRMMIDMKNV